jgi:hypothetical protein
VVDALEGYTPPTRRERIATAVLAGLFSFNGGEWMRDPGGAAKTATRAADALIEALDK